MLAIESFSPEFCDAPRYSGDQLAGRGIEERHCPEVIFVSGHHNTVAQISGTSAEMIEKHYGHLVRESAVEALSTLSI